MTIVKAAGVRIADTRSMDMLARTLPRLALIVALALVGGLRSVALTPMAGAGAIVICAGDRTELIYLDADGQPNDTAPLCLHCPDCVDPPATALPGAATGRNASSTCTPASAALRLAISRWIA
ncbi:MAG: hypothetical protein HC844_15605, partial [Tabrizicola sp.]|nr:hypothetical protein [Tabrizicola sp.]